jgi:hypothetical protein
MSAGPPGFAKPQDAFRLRHAMVDKLLASVLSQDGEIYFSDAGKSSKFALFLSTLKSVDSTALATCQ